MLLIDFDKIFPKILLFEFQHLTVAFPLNYIHRRALNTWKRRNDFSLPKFRTKILNFNFGKDPRHFFTNLSDQALLKQLHHLLGQS
jgi:hypothetical protein